MVARRDLSNGMGDREILSAAAILFCTALLAVLPARAANTDSRTGEDCGDVFQNAVGPFDYTSAEDRTRTKDAGIPAVEKFHFNSDVESLTRGQSSTNPLDDLDYTLRAVPNHHRALNSIARYDVERGGIPMQWRSAQCWFDRALRFRSDDGAVWQIYANYKARKNQHEESLDAYMKAKELMPDSVEIDYNLGLLYFKMGDYGKAVDSARIAYAGNYPLQGLRRKLADKGYSVDP